MSKSGWQKTTTELLDEAGEFLEIFGAGRGTRTVANALQERAERFRAARVGHETDCTCPVCILDQPSTEAP